ncbi:hypothetical protein DRH13_00925 [Candidatus Woesebacteria bacterium]|nr:MAG: hypothetical protein DRH13_00925 [Candidatus Woesebacteria bacterium]
MSNFLAQRLETNKRQLELLDVEIKELQKLKFVNKLPTPEEDGVHPYLYSVIGTDGLPGILIDNFPNEIAKSGQAPRTFFEGIIRVHADAPFIWTHTATTASFWRDTNNVDTGGNIIPLNVPNSQFQSIMNGQSANHATQSPTYNLGFIDSSSGRVFFQSEQQQAQVGGSETKGELTPGSVFDTNKTLTYFTNIEGAPGHGPCNFMENPAQTELPMNGTIRVLAQPSVFNQDGGRISFRVYVSLLGYKILED